MSKAILVMDMPENCDKCHLFESEQAWHGGTIKCFCLKKEIRTYVTDEYMHVCSCRVEKPDWCPLREMPKEKDIDWLASDYEDGRVIGWNDCIDEILRE